MDRRRFVRLFAAGIAAPPLLSACALDDSPPEAAVAAWRAPGAGERDIRRWALAHAVLAPHSHNLQSWLVDLSEPDQLVLACDRTRLLPQTDPFSRQIMVSHGTFLELLDLAARERGWRTEVALFPQGEFGPERVDGRPVARVRFAPDPDVARDPLFAQITKRRTNREPYDPQVPGDDALRAIHEAAALPGMHTGAVTADEPAAIAEHRTIAAQAWRIELVTPRTIMESYRVLRVGPAEIERHRDGLMLNTALARALVATGLFDRSVPPAPDSLATTSQLRSFQAAIEATPAFFWLASDGNDRVTQVRAGRAYVRAQLAATAHGLAMQPLSQALQEYPEQAGPYRRIHDLLGASAAGRTVQMWTRLGRGPAVPPAPRRGADAQLRA